MTTKILRHESHSGILEDAEVEEEFSWKIVRRRRSRRRRRRWRRRS